ncbi:MAG: hypothetical protein AAF386_02900 [Pseudomonadota bacterium]
MLSLSPRQTRTRVWLKDKLWSDRGDTQASASLRQCLHHLKRINGDDVVPFLESDNAKISLTNGTIQTDLDTLLQQASISEDEAAALFKEQLLEGLDITDPEFEDWLTLERQLWASKLEEINTKPSVKPDAVPQQKTGNLITDAKAPSVSIQAFRVEGQTDLHPYFAEGLVDDLIVAMSKNPWLKVISKNAPRGNSVLVASAGDGPDPHDARYSMDGALRFQEDAIQIHVALRETQSAAIIWSDNFKLDSQRIFEARDHISRQVSQHLTQQLGYHEQNIAYSGSWNDLETWQHVHLGKWYMSHPSKDNIAQAKRCFDHALSFDPAQPEALLALSWWHIWQAWTRIGDPKANDHLDPAFEFAKKGQRLNPNDATSYAYLGAIEILRSNPAEAIALQEEAIWRNPSLAFAYAVKGSALLQLGRAKDAADMLETASVLNPYDRYRFHTLGELASALYFAGNFEKAKDVAQKALILSPKYWYSTTIQIAALHRLAPDDPSGLKMALWRQVTSDYPDLLIRIQRIPFADPSLNQQLLDVLKTLGGQSND